MSKLSKEFVMRIGARPETRNLKLESEAEPPALFPVAVVRINQLSFIHSQSIYGSADLYVRS